MPSEGSFDGSAEGTFRPYYFACPSCGNRQAFYRTRQSSGDAAGEGCAFLLLGGITAALLHCAAQFERIQCAKCGLLFRQPAMPSSPISKAVLFPVGFAIVVFAVGALVLYCLWEFGNEWAAGVVDGARRFFESYNILSPTGVAIAGVVAGIVILTVTIANARFRRRLERKYQLRATTYPEGGRTHA